MKAVIGSKEGESADAAGRSELDMVESATGNEDIQKRKISGFGPQT